jgi:hypothetical protein
MKVPSTPYVSPVLRYDADARVTVLQYRDVDTGKVTRQVPGEQTVKAYRAELLSSAAATIDLPAAPAVKTEPAAQTGAAPSRAPNEPTISFEA